MAVNHIAISERFHLDQVPQSGPALRVFLQENEDYLLSAAELLDTDHEGERIYHMIAPVQHVQIRGMEELSSNRKDYFEAPAGKESNETAGASADGNADEKADASAGGNADERSGASADGNADETADAPADEKADETAGGNADATADASADGNADETADVSADGNADETVGVSEDSSADETADTSAGGKSDAAADMSADKSGNTEDRSGDEPALSDDTKAGSKDLYVIADGNVVGRIRPADSLHFRNLARNYKITGLELDLHGGAYRVVREEADGTVLEYQGIARWSAVLTVYRRVPRSGTVVGQESITPQQLAKLLSTLGHAGDDAAVSGSGSILSGAGTSAGGNGSGAGQAGGSWQDGNQTGGRGPEGRDDLRTRREPDRNDRESDAGEPGWIDTSYATVTQEKDPSGRGMFFLLLAAVFSICYLCFSVPGWIPSLSAGRSSLETPVIRILGLPGYVPGAVMGLGLLLNIISMFTAGGVLPTFASLLYVATGFIVPSSLIFTLIPAAFCLIGALCKKKGIAALRIILGIVTAAAASFLLYQHVSGKQIFNPFLGRELTDVESVREFISGTLPVQTDIYEPASEYFEDETDWEAETYIDEEAFWSEEEWEEDTEEGDWWEDESDLEDGLFMELETDENGNYIDREAGLISSDGIIWEAIADDEESQA